MAKEILILDILRNPRLAGFAARLPANIKACRLVIFTTMAERTIDIATGLGETFALPPAGLPLATLGQVEGPSGTRLHPRHTLQRNDDDMLPIISTGYVACGAHSGDEITMFKTMRVLSEQNAVIGVHPSYPDIFGFGQESQDLSMDELEAILVSQLASADAIARKVGSRIRTVKCHGALSFDVACKPEIARTMARAILQTGEGISLVVFAGSIGADAESVCGVEVLHEAYIDRAYDSKGFIISRKLPGALITNPEKALEQAISIAAMSHVKTVEGEYIPMKADTICLHIEATLCFSLFSILPPLRCPPCS